MTVPPPPAAVGRDVTGVSPASVAHCVKRAKEHAEDTCQLVYQCRLSLSTRTVNHLADLLRRHLKAIRSR